jgi:acyl carrier protein
MLIGFICEELLDGEFSHEITPDDDLLLSGLIDSMGVVRLIQFMEEKLDVQIPPEDVTLENFLTVRAMGEYVGRRRLAG